ncbi:glycosyl hydrolases family 31-domain-containing protein [Papiliotrema laurentii]|uniref:Maltase n=1 Tax=Papiliotrema laurentii TaxID=5418 RepID=A0AAD9CXV3_PAPLA|nr:glycosyl hydrolases family 31-domain-containing protein [Papiliotrema laurentii]
MDDKAAQSAKEDDPAQADQQGYTVTEVRTTLFGLTAHLSLLGPAVNAYGNDVQDLILDVQQQAPNRLRVHIYDAAGKHFQIPHHVLPFPPDGRSTDCDMHFEYTSHPFAFWVSRKSTRDIIFDTRSSSIPLYKENLTMDHLAEPATHGTAMHCHPLVFSDQYLQLSTALPSDANVYGLGEYVGSLRRKEEVQTMWNMDNVAKRGNNMYGSHPFYMETRWRSGTSCNETPTSQPPTSASHGVFMRNSHGMDVLVRDGVLQCKILGGTLDLYFVSGPSPQDVVRQYSEIVGRPARIPDWAFGFHLSELKKMKEAEIPLETVWSDLDYMDRKRNFEVSADFEPKRFGALHDWLKSCNQHYIPLVDAAIAVPGERDRYKAYERGKEMDIWIKAPNGEDIQGTVWPGLTVFPDWTHRSASSWMAECLDDFRKTVSYDGRWFDMNEPASFATGYDLNVLPTDSDDGKRAKLSRISQWRGKEILHPCEGEDWRERKKVETAMALEWSKIRGGDNGLDYPPYRLHETKGCLGSHTVPPSGHLADGTRVYNQHNLYRKQGAIAIREALSAQDPGKRHFVLSRSTFAGQGRGGLGDNDSDWISMKQSIAGVLQFQILQMPMVGPDACGFFGDATEELCARWMALAAFFPFYRNHNCLGCSDQEPYRWASVAEATRKGMRIRYALLPMWESLFIKANLDGTAPVRPLFFEFGSAKYRDVDEQFLIGSGLLVTPVLEEGATAVRGHFPSMGGTFWRDWYTHQFIQVDENDTAEISAPLDHLPLHVRSGSVLLVYNEPGYTIAQTKKSALGLVVCLDSEDRASGEFYIDDGTTSNGPHCLVEVEVVGREVSISVQGEYQPRNKITRITVLGNRTTLIAVEGREDAVPVASGMAHAALPVDLIGDQVFNW